MYSISHEKMGIFQLAMLILLKGVSFKHSNSGFREGSQQVPFIKMNRLSTPLLQLFGKTLKDTVPAPVDR